MAILDQIKTMMKSGDIAGAETLCRSHHAGRDVSTKRPQTDAPWARPYRRVASRRSKVISLWALVFATLLAPLAACADIASPPNDYTGFLYHGRHYVGSSSTSGVVSFAIVLLLVFVGVFLLTEVVEKRRRKEANAARNRKKPIILEYVVLSILLYVSICAMIAFFKPFEVVSSAIVLGGHSWPLLWYLDTPAHRAEYDRKCIESYNTWEPPALPLYMWGRGEPIMRKNAPQAVRDAYERFLLRESAAADAAPHGFGYGSNREDPEVLERIRAAARAAVESCPSSPDSTQNERNQHTLPDDEDRP